MHDQSEERAKSCETTSSNGKTLLDAGPDSNIDCIPLLMLIRAHSNIEVKQLTEEVGRVQLSKERQSRNDGSASDATHGEKWN